MVSRLNLKVLILISIILITGSIMYDFFYINLPFQDPSEEIIMKRIQQIFTKEIVFYSGLFFFLTVVLVKILKVKNTKQ